MPVWLFLKAIPFGNIFSWILKHWFQIVCVLFVVAAVWTWFSVIPNMQKQQQQQVAKYEQLSKDHASLKLNFETYKQNQLLLDEGLSASSTVKSGQARVKERNRNVPVTSSGKPFADPGMRERGKRMRSYQQTSPVYQFE